MIEMNVESIRVSLMNYQRVVILKEKLSERYLPIWIGPSEADAIAMKLHDVSMPRPMTHDLLRSIILALGASIKYIVVTDLVDDTFYAKIVIESATGLIEIDSRPSDAIALAVRVGVLIFAEELVLDKAGVTIDHETGKLTHSTKVSEEEIKKMSAFRDFIDTLNLEDFGEGKTQP
ncbi:MAG: bifunctional nuclease family protein [Chloroflexi bacterium]|nr:bifunctional nuclease family protein [Chloroflexota bacterium]